MTRTCALLLAALPLTGADAPPAGQYVCTIVNYTPSGMLADQYVDTLTLQATGSYRLEVIKRRGDYTVDADAKLLRFNSGPLSEHWEAKYDVSPRGVVTIKLHDQRKGSRQFDWRCSVSRGRSQ